MDLISTESMSVQEKFMLMMLDRLDKLTDEVSKMNTSIVSIEKDMPPTLIKYPQLENDIHIYKNDLTAQAKRCFVRCVVIGEGSGDTIVEYIKNHKDVQEVVYLCNPAEELLYKCKQFEYIGEVWRLENSGFKEDDIQPFPDKHVYVYQAMITFDTSVYTAKFVAKLYDTFNDIIYKDVNGYNRRNAEQCWVSCVPLNCEINTAYIEYHLAAGQNNRFVGTINLIEPVVQYCGKKEGVRKGLCLKDETFTSFFECVKESIVDDDDGDIFDFTPWLKRGINKLSV